MFLPLRADGPRLRFPTATVALVLGNLAVFAWQLTLSPPAFMHLAEGAGVVPWEFVRLYRHLVVHLPGHQSGDLIGHARFIDGLSAGFSDGNHPGGLVPPPLSIFTSMFLHGDVLHLAGNLWFLWVFGARLEGLVGPLRFVLGFFLAGAVAALVQVAALPSSTTPMIGASGAVAGVLGAHARAFPRAQVRCLVFMLFFAISVRLPAVVLLGLWFLGQVAAATAAAAAGGPRVAWYAHGAGFLCGLVFASLATRPRLRVPSPA